MAESAPQSVVRANQSWQLLTLLFSLANLLEVAVIAHFVLFTPTFLDTIGFSKAEIDAWTGPIASAAFLVGIWFVPFWGVLADRYGRKPLILVYTGKMVSARVAARALGLPESAIVPGGDPGGEWDLKIILGTDWR